MPDYWSLDPEVAGEIGDASVLDASVHPPAVSKLQYRLSGWLGDDLLETFACFIATESLASELEAAGFTGFHLDTVEIARSPEFDELYPGRQLPEFRWLKVTGRAGADDLGLSDAHRLVVSTRVLEALRRHQIEHCDVERFKS